MACELAVSVEWPRTVPVEVVLDQPIPVTVDTTQGLPGPAGESFPVLTDIAELDSITETGVVLLDDIAGVAALLGADPSLLEDGPVLVASLGLLGGVQVFQTMYLAMGEYQRLIVAGSSAGWLPVRVPAPSQDGVTLLSQPGPVGYEWNTERVSSTATNRAIVRRDASGRAQVAAPSAPLDIANKAYVDAVAGATTGWRDVTATHVVSGSGSAVAVTAGRYLIRRDGQQVTAQIESLDPAAPATLRMPSGFWVSPSGSGRATGTLWDDSGAPLRIRSEGSAFWRGIASSEVLTPGTPRSAMLTWWTSQSWPSTLPGTAA